MYIDQTIIAAAVAFINGVSIRPSLNLGEIAVMVLRKPTSLSFGLTIRTSAIRQPVANALN